MFKSGKNWIEGRTRMEQNYWKEHAKFINNLCKEKKIRLGGSASDYKKIFLMVMFDSKDEV